MCNGHRSRCSTILLVIPSFSAQCRQSGCRLAAPPDSVNRAIDHWGCSQGTEKVLDLRHRPDWLRDGTASSIIMSGTISSCRETVFSHDRLFAKQYPRSTSGDKSSRDGAWLAVCWDNKKPSHARNPLSLWIVVVNADLHIAG